MKGRSERKKYQGVEFAQAGFEHRVLFIYLIYLYFSCTPCFSEIERTVYKNLFKLSSPRRRITFNYFALTTAMAL